MTDGDPWFAKQYSLKSEAKEDNQLSPGGPSNRQKSSGPNHMLHVYMINDTNDESFHPVILNENYLICIFMNINENVKKNEGKPLDKLVPKGVIRPTLNN